MAAEGWYWFFGVIDHHVDEIVGWHSAKLGDRWAALEPNAALRRSSCDRVLGASISSELNEP
jgi:hypothetical protein